ncbi:MAG: porin family protein, partial [Sphingomonadaceae bacterium]|nr:porin family protein [Sphingomonadaceae bacterium]
MRNLVIGVAMASTALASPALARDGQWYVGVDGGAMIVQDLDMDINTIVDAGRIETDTGFDFGGVVGYDFGPVRLEAEGSYREADTDVVAITRGGFPSGVALTGAGSFPAAGDANALSFMVNALADFGDDDGLQGFVGGGVGVARVDVSTTVNTAGPGLNDSDTGFAWQALAGVRAPLTDSWDIGLKYRYFNAPGVDLVDGFGQSINTKWTSH